MELTFDPNAIHNYWYTFDADDNETFQVFEETPVEHVDLLFATKTFRDLCCNDL